jgi:cyclase
MRGNKILGPFLFVLIISGSGWVRGRQQKPAPQYRRPEVEIKALSISGGLYELKGGVSNSAFYVGEKGVYVIDTKMTPDEAGKMQSAIAGQTNKSVTHIILTHSDGDHVGGLAGFPQGPAIIAHLGTARHMEAAAADDEQKAFLPNTTFTDEMSIQTGQAEINLKYFGRAHTDGDAVVFFPKERAAICGDLIFVGRDPLIHRQKNGSAKGVIEVLKKILALEADTFLNGHADPIGRAELQMIIDQLEEKAAKVKELYSAGKSLEEVKKAMGIEESGGQRRWPSYPENLYLELAEKK